MDGFDDVSRSLPFLVFCSCWEITGEMRTFRVAGQPVQLFTDVGRNRGGAYEGALKTFPPLHF